MNHRKSLLALAVASFFTSSMSYAEEAAKEDDYEVIVVTQKRAQTLKEVPVSVSAFNENFIDDYNIDNAVALSKFTPGLNGGTSNDSFVDTIGIRGIVTQDYGIGGDPSIGLYFDGVYQGRSGGALGSFFDISRVEVTKGPQGTLFGRNAASGAISIYSNDAVDGTEGSIEGALGSDSLTEFTGVFNTNLSDNLFLRVAGHYSSEDNHVENLAGEELRGRDVAAVRGILKYEGDDTMVRLSANYEDRDMDGGIYRSIWTEGPGDAIETDLGKDSRDVAEVTAVTLDIEHDFGSVIFTSQTAMKNYTWDYVEDYDGTAMPFGDYSQVDDTEYVSQEFRLNSDNDSDIYWFVGVSAYKETIDSQFYNKYDDDAFCSYLPYFEEWDEPLSDITSDPGPYYADCHELFVDGWYELDFVEDADDIQMMVDEGDIPPPGGGELGVREEVFARGTNQGWGIYGDITWSVTDATDITIGARYSYDEKEFGLNLPEPDGWLGHYWLVGAHTAGEWIDDKQDWSEFTPRVAINHQLTDEINVYANYSRGYKAGGYNTFAFNINFMDWTGFDEDEEWFDYEPDGVIDDIDEAYWESELYGGELPEGSTLASYDPEIVDSYEIGMKGDFFDNSLNVNLGVYYYDYTDFQGTFPNAGGVIIKNIGEAEGKGVEFDATWTPTDNLRLFVASALQNSEVKEGESAEGESIVGQKLSAPEATFTFIGTYSWSLSSETDIDVQLSYAWQSETFGDEFMGGSDLLEQDAYGLLGAVANVYSGSWQFSAYVDNITDELYYEGAVIDTGYTRFGIGQGINGGIKAKYSF
ncbi:TonB-dependent receptor [Thalassotalea sp. PS06]|uniref:TonB-dependent receptor n=1 Tax=Thalassotalea sp. PS06 TaxID=2594005 RepID=UPI001162768C|nr:TonB-dependent receptor [Thalassotalea sp. PS06]QDP00074.1 TonB-dependent receptor [Thalassotalea sp. PS06]